VDAQGGCQAEVSSETGYSSNVLQITGPGGLSHHLVQGLANSTSEGGQDGIWRLNQYADEYTTLLAAFTINHPDAYFCDFTNADVNGGLPEDVEQFILSWDQQRGYYVSGPLPDDPEYSAGLKIEGENTLCLEIFGPNSPPGNKECYPVTRVNSWDEATAGDLGLCETPPNLP
jgi:hypothetical protein